MKFVLDDGGGVLDEVGGDANVKVVQVGVGGGSGVDVRVWVCVAKRLELVLDA